MSVQDPCQDNSRISLFAFQLATYVRPTGWLVNHEHINIGINKIKFYIYQRTVILMLINAFWIWNFIKMELFIVNVSSSLLEDHRDKLLILIVLVNVQIMIIECFKSVLFILTNVNKQNISVKCYFNY